jgi:acetate kinase
MPVPQPATPFPLRGPVETVLRGANVSYGPGEPAALDQVDAVGHRITHGGTLFSLPVVVDGSMRQRLESLTDLAPLHQPTSLAALDAVSAVLLGVPAVACFDTAFHASVSTAATYALPAEWWTLRRYGLHGLSHAYVSRRAIALPGSQTSSRVLTSHFVIASPRGYRDRAPGPVRGAPFAR